MEKLNETVALLPDGIKKRFLTFINTEISTLQDQVDTAKMLLDTLGHVPETSEIDRFKQEAFNLRSITTQIIGWQ